MEVKIAALAAVVFVAAGLLAPVPPPHRFETPDAVAGAPRVITANDEASYCLNGSGQLDPVRARENGPLRRGEPSRRSLEPCSQRQECPAIPLTIFMREAAMLFVFRWLMQPEKRAVVIECGLVASLIAVAAIASMGAIGTKVSEVLIAMK
jgi:Flp pilus assembly pilin Flp